MFPQQKLPTVSGKARYNILKNILNASKSSDLIYSIFGSWCNFLSKSFEQIIDFISITNRIHIDKIHIMNIGKISFCK